MMKRASSDPFISVILPAYNAEPYLEASINSILSQTYTNFELLVINDGSTDGTLATMQRFAACDERVKVIDNGVNIGLIATLNKGLSLAKGDFIARQDGDDISHPHRFERQIQFFETNEDVGLLGTAMEMIDECGRPTEIYLPPETDGLIRFRLLFNNAFVHTSVMFRRKLLEKHQLCYEEGFNLIEDYHLWVRLLNVTRGYNIQTPLVKYRIYSGSVSQKHLAEQCKRAHDFSTRQIRLLDAAANFTWEEKGLMLHVFMQHACGTRRSVPPEEHRALEGLVSLSKLALERFPEADARLRAFAVWAAAEVTRTTQAAIVNATSEKPQIDYSLTPTSRDLKGIRYGPQHIDAAPVVSIITPFFNTGEEFLETAQSVLRQSLQEFEWLIINDGSTDAASLKRLDPFRNGDPRIRVIDHPKNLGLPAARNTGYSAARADLVCQLDSDDLIEPTMVEKCAWFLTSYASISMAKGYSIGFGAKQYLWKYGFEHTGEFFENNPITPTAVVRKAAHIAAGGYDVARRAGFEDWDFWLRCAAKGHWGATIPEYLEWYRTRECHSDRWPAFKKEERENYRLELLASHSELKKTGFPQVNRWQEKAVGSFNEKIPFANILRKKKRRLLFILPWFAVGGAEKFNLDLLKLLIENHDYEITVCATIETDLSWLSRFQQLTPDIFILPNFLQSEDQPRFVSYLIESRQVDACLVTSSLVGYQFLPYLRSRFPDLPILDFLHIEQESWRDGNYPRFSVNLGFCLDLTVVSSNYLKNWMVERGADPSRVEVCYTNVDTKLLHPSTAQRASIRKDLGIDESTPVILFAARLSEQKRPKILAQTIMALEEAGDEFICLVAGDGPDEPWLRSFIRTNKLKKIRLLGLKSPEEVGALMAAADVLFLPSENEGVSLACYEAMAVGLPIVCSDVGGQSELITPECGILVQKNQTEVAEYVKALQTLIAKPALRAEMKTAARCRVEQHFRIEEMGSHMTALIAKAECLRRQSPRSSVSREVGRAYCIETLEQNRLARENQFHAGATRNATAVHFEDLSFQIFVQRAGAFSEETSARGMYSSGQSTVVSMRLPEWAGRVVRIDPSNAAGVIHIEEVLLRDEEKGDVVWSASRPSDFSGLKVKGTARQIPNKNHLVIFSWGLDPQVFISVKRSKRPVVLEVKMKHQKHMTGLDAAIFDGSPRAADSSLAREIAVQLSPASEVSSGKGSLLKRITKNLRL